MVHNTSSSSSGALLTFKNIQKGKEIAALTAIKCDLASAEKTGYYFRFI